MENSIKEKCMAKVYSNTQVAKYTMENMSMENDKVKANGEAQKI